MSQIYIDSNGNRYGTGLLPSPREEIVKFASRYSISKIPRSQWVEVDYSQYAGAVYDQGQQGSCAGHMLASQMNLIWSMHGRTPKRFSPCFAYGMVNGGRDQGAVISDLLKLIKTDGICLESTVGPGKWQPSSWPANARAEAKRFTAEKAEELQGFDEIATALQYGDPVGIGVFTGNRFEPNASGILPDLSGTGGGHAMCVTGLRNINGKWYLIVKNSWAERWGVSGYCYMPESFFQKWHEAYRILVAKDDPENPEAPPVAKDPVSPRPSLVFDPSHEQIGVAA
jgi:Papain family cysteine protease